MSSHAVRLRVPRPNGNQPTRPPDDPLAELLAASVSESRYYCPLGGRPTVPCVHGARGHCAWGVRTEADLYCVWVFILRHPHGAYEQELAEALGMSRERIRYWLGRALGKLEARGAELREAYDAA